MTRIERPAPPVLLQPAVKRSDRWEWLVTTDHKRLGLLICGTALVLFYAFGGVAMTMRAQLMFPDQHITSNQMYNQLFTLHGSGMIYLMVTPIALGLGVYLVPLMIGAPAMAAPRLTLLGYWLYVSGAVALICGAAVPQGASDGWWSYIPLSNQIYTPGTGQNLWLVGAFMATLGEIFIAWSVLLTALTRRAPGMTMMKLPIFVWSEIVTVFMVVTSFPALLAALGLQGWDRMHPFNINFWNLMYEELFWFYGHPVVYVMFFPFVGCVMEAVVTFSNRRLFGYKGTVLALLTFAAGSMAVWAHHLFVSGQVHDDYYSLTSNFLAIPAGIEYFAGLGTLLGGRLRYTTSMLFALTWFPQFFIGGATGILVANPAIDYHFNDSYAIVAHFHYTLFAGSVFGLFAGIYLWLPKATGIMLSERLGKVHWLLMTIGTNTTFIPFFILGYLGMPRRVVTYKSWWFSGIDALNFTASIGAFIIGVSMLVFAYNVYISARRKIPAGPDPWGTGNSLEWATSSPPPPFNFNAQFPVPKIRSYAPLMDIRERQERASQNGGDQSGEEDPG